MFENKLGIAMPSSVDESMVASMHHLTTFNLCHAFSGQNICKTSSLVLPIDGKALKILKEVCFRSRSVSFSSPSTTLLSINYLVGFYHRLQIFLLTHSIEKKLHAVNNRACYKYYRILFHICSC
jgi:hypothetical protein